MSGECHLHDGRFFDPTTRQWGYEVYCSNEAPHKCTGERELFQWWQTRRESSVTVEPREIVELLRDLPSIRDGFESDEAREAWLERKRDLLARIEAEGDHLDSPTANASPRPEGLDFRKFTDDELDEELERRAREALRRPVGEVPVEIAADLESWGDEFEVNDRLGPIGQTGAVSEGDA